MLGGKPPCPPTLRNSIISLADALWSRVQRCQPLRRRAVCVLAQGRPKAPIMLVRIPNKPFQLRGTTFDNWAPTFERDIVPAGPLPPHPGIARMGPNSPLDAIYGPGRGSACFRGAGWCPPGNRREAPSNTSPRTQATKKRGISPRARYRPP